MMASLAQLIILIHIILLNLLLITCDYQTAHPLRVYYRHYDPSTNPSSSPSNFTSNIRPYTHPDLENLNDAPHSKQSLPQTYIMDDNGFTLNETIGWCSQIGGYLPFIRSQEDMVFLLDSVVMKGTLGYCDNIWLGRKPVSLSQITQGKPLKKISNKEQNERLQETDRQWLDNSSIEFNLKYGHRSYCAQEDCCGLYVSNSADSNERGSVWFSDCDAKHRRVCVIDGIHTLESLGLQSYHFDQSFQDDPNSIEVKRKEKFTGRLFILFILLTVISLVVLFLVLMTIRQVIRKTRDKENIQSVMPIRYELNTDNVRSYVAPSCINNLTPRNTPRSSPHISPRLSLVNNNVYDSYEPVRQRDVELSTFPRQTSR